MPPSTTPAEDEAAVVDTKQSEMTQEQVDALINDELANEMPNKQAVKPVEGDKDPKDEPKSEEVAPEVPDDEEVVEDEENEEEVEEVPEDDKKEETPDPEGLFIEVEDFDGKKYKITKESDLPEDFQPKNNRQVIEILRQLDQLDLQKKELATQEETKKQEEQLKQQRDDTMQIWDSEIETLFDEGLFDRPKAKPGTKLWETDPAVLKADSVFKFMIDENKKRTDAGKIPINSFTQAFYIQQARDGKAKAAKDIKEENAEAKAKAALIGKTGTPNSTPDVYRVGSARSIEDVVI